MSLGSSRLKNEKLLLGKINGLFGIKGWVKVFSYTQPRSKIVEYKHWYLTRDLSHSVEVETGHAHKAGVVVKLSSIEDRDAAADLVGQEIWVASEELAALPENEYYWYQLIGLDVFDCTNKYIGVIKDLMETGANDVLIVSAISEERNSGQDSKKSNKEYLIPYLQDQVVKTIDLENKRMVVDWDADY